MSDTTAPIPTATPVAIAELTFVDIGLTIRRNDDPTGCDPRRFIIISNKTGRRRFADNLHDLLRILSWEYWISGTRDDNSLEAFVKLTEKVSEAVQAAQVAFPPEPSDADVQRFEAKYHQSDWKTVRALFGRRPIESPR